jgi:hypothetical protein
MIKLVNLLIIFIALNYLLPFLISNVESIPRNLFYTSLITSIGIFLIEIAYNYCLNSYKIKTMTVKQNLYNALFKALLVFVGYYIYEDIKADYNITIPGISADNTIRNVFVIIIMTFFIVTKCLITP